MPSSVRGVSARRPKNHPIRRGTARLQMETLEAREVPAGLVTITLQLAPLANHQFALRGITLTGDNAGNEVVIQATPNNHFLMQGANGTTFRMPDYTTPAPNDFIDLGDTVDTSLFPPNLFAFRNDGKTNFNVKFGDGNDIFEYAGFTYGQGPRSFGDVKIETGLGNDQVLIRQTIAKNMHIVAGALNPSNVSDNDVVTVAAGGWIDLIGGDGIPETYSGGIRNRLQISGVTGADNFTIAATTGGSLVVDVPNDGGDSVHIRGGSRIGGNVIINTFKSTAGSYNLTVNENTQIATSLEAYSFHGVAVNATLQDVTVGTWVMIHGGNAGSSNINVSNVTAGTIMNFGGGSHQDVFVGQNLLVGTHLIVAMKGGGTASGGDKLINSRIGGDLKVFQGDGDDVFSIQNTTIGKNATIENGLGVDHFDYQGGRVSGNLKLVADKGGNVGAGNPDLISGVTIHGDLDVSFAAVGDVAHVHVDNSVIYGHAKFNVWCKSVVALQNSSILGNLTLTGGPNRDVITLNNLFVAGSTTIRTNEGFDEVNFLTAGRFKGEVKVNTGPATRDAADLISLNAAAGQELVFLGGVAVDGGGSSDTFAAGNTDGVVHVLNLLKLDRIEIFDIGSNFYFLPKPD